MRKGFATDEMTMYTFAIVLTFMVLAAVFVLFMIFTSNVCWGNFYQELGSFSSNFPNQEGQAVRRYIEIGSCVKEFGVFNLADLENIETTVSEALNCPAKSNIMIAAIPDNEQIKVSLFSPSTWPTTKKEIQDLIASFKTINPVCFAPYCKSGSQCKVSTLYRYPDPAVPAKKEGVCLQVTKVDSVTYSVVEIPNIKKENCENKK